jgi:hypothetical protein
MYVKAQKNERKNRVTELREGREEKKFIMGPASGSHGLLSNRIQLTGQPNDDNRVMKYDLSHFFLSRRVRRRNTYLSQDFLSLSNL